MNNDVCDNTSDYEKASPTWREQEKISENTKNIKIIKKQASMERLRVLYMGRETIPDIREAVFTNREKRSSPLITLNSIRIIQEEVHF